MASQRRSSSETREHVLDVAHELFYWQGIRSVGVDKIAAEAGIAPTTLYRLFASKDDLIAAYLQRAHVRYREWFSAATEAGGDDPRAQILAVFDELLIAIQPDRCRGCPFLMALAEFPDEGLASHREAVAMKRWVHDQFAVLCERLEVSDPGLLADHLTLIFEGAYASVQPLGLTGPARQARLLAETLLPA